MKVPGSNGNSEALKRVKEEISIRQRQVSTSKAASSDSLTSALEKGGQKGQVDTVTLSPLLAEMQKQLDPAQMKAERQARVAALKQQISDGTYQQPSADRLAQSVGEEITVNILLDGSVA
jgi:anti-sigma28 factor (negative regulator of flagellin synthesis)